MGPVTQHPQKRVFLLILGSPFSRVHFVFSPHKGGPFCPKDVFKPLSVEQVTPSLPAFGPALRVK